MIYFLIFIIIISFIAVILLSKTKFYERLIKVDNIFSVRSKIIISFVLILILLFLIFFLKSRGDDWISIIFYSSIPLIILFLLLFELVGDYIKFKESNGENVWLLKILLRLIVVIVLIASFLSGILF